MNDRTWVGRALRVMLVVVMVLPFIGYFAPAASAHHPEILATAACQPDGSVQVSYTAHTWNGTGDGQKGNANIGVYILDAAPPTYGAAFNGAGFSGTPVGSGAFTSDNGYQFTGSFAWPALNPASIDLMARADAAFNNGSSRWSAWAVSVVRPDCPVPSIDIEKATNGQGADSPTGPSILVGDPVNWTYVVTNTGNVPLSNVSVTDSDAGVTPVYVSGDTNSNSLLDLTETWTFSASGIASLGQYANIGSVVGTPPDGRDDVKDSDPSHYFGSAPDIEIEKATNDEDADDPTGPEILVGDPVTWTYVVTNTGNVPLSNVTVTDDQGVSVSCPATTLAVGASMTCTASGIAVAGQYANIGSVEGFPPESELPVTDTDPSHYYGTARLVPAVDIEKATNGDDADDPRGPRVLVGGVVNWTYVVTNTGDVTLYDLVVTDSDAGVSPDCPVIEALAPGDSFTCTATGSASLGQYSNIGYVTGYPDDSDAQVQDEDPSHYYGYEGSTPTPVIRIEKATNGVDADTGVGPTLNVGDSVVWTYVVTNKGDVALSNVKVTDDRGVVPVYASGDINFNSVLDPKETWTFTASGTAVAGLYANIGSVEGSYLGTTVTDDDPSHYNASLVSPTTVVNTTVPETLPFTGPTSTGVGGVGAAMVLLGGLVLLAFRKKGDSVVQTGAVRRLDR